MNTILAIKLLSEVHHKFSHPLHDAYVDLELAFDSVHWQVL